MEATPSRVPDPCLVELCSVAERALNYMHTGNTAVISTTVMNPLWIGNAVVHDGLPCFNKNIISLHGNSQVQVSIIKERWPYNQAKLQPKTSSSAAQIFAYDISHFNVSISPFCNIPPFRASQLADIFSPHWSWCSCTLTFCTSCCHNPWMLSVHIVHPALQCSALQGIPIGGQFQSTLVIATFHPSCCHNQRLFSVHIVHSNAPRFTPSQLADIFCLHCVFQPRFSHPSH